MLDEQLYQGIRKFTAPSEQAYGSSLTSSPTKRKSKTVTGSEGSSADSVGGTVQQDTSCQAQNIHSLARYTDE